MRCYLEQQHQGHQQLVTCMEVVGNTVLTGSQDHTLKVSSQQRTALKLRSHEFDEFFS